MTLRPTVRDIAIVLAVSWVARAVFVAAIGDHHSLDVEFWRVALDAQDQGRNPYETGRLNWPPLWLMVIVGLDHAASAVGISFLSALRLYLVLVESVMVVALYLTLVRAGVRRDAVRGRVRVRPVARRIRDAGDAAWITDISKHLDDPREVTVFRLPLFAIYLLIVAAGVARLAGSRVGHATQGEA